jgi:hypothetical protein
MIGAYSDAGRSHAQTRPPKTAGRRLCRLLAFWQPMRLIVREGASRREYEMARALAPNAKVPVVDVRRVVVQDAFRSSKRPSRFDSARVVARRTRRSLPFACLARASSGTGSLFNCACSLRQQQAWHFSAFRIARRTRCRNGESESRSLHSRYSRQQTHCLTTGD